MNFILFAPFKSQVFSYSSVQFFQIVGIFLQFDSVHIFQIVGIFLQFSSIHKFQIVGIFLQFGPIHIKKITLFKSYNHSNFPATHLSNCRYFPTIQFNTQLSNCWNFPTIWSNQNFRSFQIVENFLHLGLIVQSTSFKL